MRWSCSAVPVVLLAACLAPRAEEAKRVGEPRAQELFETYLGGQKQSAADYAISFHPFGQATWIVHARDKRIGIDHPRRYILDAEGRICDLTVGGLCHVYSHEYSSTPTEHERQDLVRSFVRQHTGDPIVVLSSPSDIPGHDMAPVDADLAQAIRAPYSFDDRHSGRRVTVIYTYQQLQGLVRRYRFQFQKDGGLEQVHCVEAAQGVGDARYLK
jgi:hypothetical protein